MLQPPRLARLQHSAEILKPRDDVQRFAGLFGWRPEVPGVDRTNFEAYNNGLWELRRQAMPELLSAGASAISQLAHRVEVPHTLGVVLAEQDHPASDALLAWLDEDDPALRELARAWAAQRLWTGGAAWLEETLARGDFRDGARRRALATACPAQPEFWDALAKVDQELATAYWEGAYIGGVETDALGRAVDSLVAHGRGWAAVDAVAMALHSKGHKNVDSQLIKNALDGALQSVPDNLNSTSPGYEVAQLLDALEASGAAEDLLASYEFAFFGLLEHQRPPRTLFVVLGRQPEQFVDLIRRAFRPALETTAEPDKSQQEIALGQHAWRVLRAWRGLPGFQTDGRIDTAALTGWVREARHLLAEADRLDVGDEQIGEVLACAPIDTDGTWPAKPVRDIIEAAVSTRMETGLLIGVLNRLGVTTRGAFEGGQQERDLAEQYRVWADACSPKWRRTAKVLRKIAESYEQDARRFDQSADATGNLD